MAPRLYPCMRVIYDPNNSTDPYWKNPPITANFYNLTSWKNGRNGAIGERMGDVRFHKFKVSDNLLAGIEYSIANEYGDNMAQINDCLINGRSNNSDENTDAASPRGVITARTENFLVHNNRFFNFNWRIAAAFGTCSHCFHPAATDSGARTVTLRNNTFDSTVTLYINYQFPYADILHDLDGSLTGLGPNSWATPYRAHHNLKECLYSAKHQGSICDGTIQVRRVDFNNYLPNGVLTGMQMKILPIDDEIFVQPGFNKTAYVLNRTNYGNMMFRDLTNPLNSWAVPFVTGHKYKFSFGEAGIDWLQMQVDLSVRWQEDDKPIYFVHNFTDVRARANFKIYDNRYKGGTYNNTWLNDSIPKNSADYYPFQNKLYPDQSVRELHFIVSGKNLSHNPWQETKALINMDQCVGACNAQVIEDNVPKENFTRYWSNASHWPNNTLPKENDTVEIMPGQNWIYDLANSPIYKLVIVNGNFTFKNDTDLHLNCKHLFVRAGELHIGSEDYPFTYKATITLHGLRNDETIVFDNAIEAGSKVLANVNKVYMYGVKRKQALMRLRAEVHRNDNQILIDTGLDLVPGDRLALFPTSFVPDAVDDVFVQTYDNLTGLVTLNSSLNYYHFGASESTASKYSGVDIRGEVILLTRNVLIEGTDQEAWGCQIVTSDTVEIYDGKMTPRYGQMFLDSVEIKNCSQRDSYKAAVRFDTAATLWSMVSNCAIHNGFGWGVHIILSENIVFFNNMIFGFQPIGFGVQTSKNITIDSNVFGYQTPRPGFSAQMTIDKEGGFSICAYDPIDKCSDIRVRNNIAAGSTYAGFAIGVSYKCGEENTQQVFRNNIAHSNYGKRDTGYGATFQMDNTIPDNVACFPFSNFAAYKNAETGAIAFQPTLNMSFSNLVLIDNHYGFSQNLENRTDRDEYLDVWTHASNIKVYGETESLDCPNNGLDGFCFTIEKYAMISSGGCQSGKSAQVTAMTKLPFQKMKSNAQWGVKVRVDNLQVFGFKGVTRYGKDQAIFHLNTYNADYFPIHTFTNTKFTDVREDALADFFQPPQGWANPDDCLQWPCSGPLNVLFTFKDSVYEGDSPSWLGNSFQLISNNVNISAYIPDCRLSGNKVFYICKQNKGLGILIWDSLDEDKQDRSSQPIIYKKQGSQIANYLNAFMDHVWDGFYSGQLRLQRFPGLVWAPSKSIYDVIMTGSPPKNMRFKLLSEDSSASMMIRIAYPSADSRQVLLNGVRVPMNEWDDRIRNYGEIKFTTCGENRYIGVKNILEFYLTSGCQLDIKPRDAIQTLVRMEWTMEAFFSKGGTTAFVDRLAGSLGIHASSIKMVSVYQGSLVVNYAITSDDDDKEALKQIQQNQNSLFATNAIDLGAPILDVKTTMIVNSPKASTSQEEQPQSIVTNGVVTAPGFQPIVITQIQSNQDNSAFIPNLTVSQSNQTVYTDVLIKKENQVITIQQQQQIEQQIIDGKVELYTKTESWIYIIVGVFVVIVLIVIALVFRYFKNKQSADLIMAQKYAERRLDGGLTEVKLKSNVANDGKINAGDSQLVETSAQKLHGNVEMEVFEAQYDPAQDFAIFGVGDKTRGGLQSLKEKMNLADGLNSQDNESSEDEGNRIQSQPKMSSGVDHQNSDGYNFIEGSVYSDTSIVVSSARKVQFTENTTVAKKINYDLPEDQEIKEEEEEEEEE